MRQKRQDRTGIPRSVPVLLLALLALPGAASAQVDPLFAGSELDEEAPAEAWRPYADAMFRAESTRGFENRDNIERLRSRLRAGADYQNANWQFRLGMKAGLGSDSNRDNRRNLDNETSNGAGIDEFMLRWESDDAQRSVQLGKSRFPLVTSPLTWDEDLRPIGASLRLSRQLGDFNRWSVVAGYFAGDHLYGDDSRIGAVQVSGFFREGAALSAALHLSWWHFDDLQTAVDQGLMRSNRIVNGRLLSDYRLLNLQGVLRWLHDGQPLDLRLDVVENRGANDQNRGARVSAVYGTTRVPQSWEWAVSYQRIGRDAVPAAFSADDWWFHSAARGVMPWVGYAFDATWSLQLSYFRERLDGRDERIQRWLLDLRADW